MAENPVTARPEDLEIACPICAKILVVRGHSQSVHCPACGNEFPVEGFICASCGTYHEQAVGYCRQCEAPMRHVCQACYSTNWAGNKTCRQCGARLSSFSQQQAGGFKAQAGRTQQQELAHSFGEEETTPAPRLSESQQQWLQKQKAQERLLAFMVLAGITLFVVVLVILFLIRSLP